jgi:hypothetical protein
MLEMQDDKASIPVHAIDLDNVKVLIWLEKDEGVKGKKMLSLVSHDRKMSMTRFWPGE